MIGPDAGLIYAARRGSAAREVIRTGAWIARTVRQGVKRCGIRSDGIDRAPRDNVIGELGSNETAARRAANGTRVEDGDRLTDSADQTACLREISRPLGGRREGLCGCALSRLAYAFI